jgi:hypothetical protein
MEQWWNETDRGKLKYWEKNLSYCHFVHHKPHMDWPEIESGLCILCCDIHTKHTNFFCGPNAQFLNVIPGGMLVVHIATTGLDLKV